MKLTLYIDDKKYDELEALASKRNKTVDALIVDGLDLVAAHNSRENQILLDGAAVAAIAATVGGKTLRSADDVVKLFQTNFRVKLGGVEYDLDVEDAHALKDQYSGFSNFMSYDEFVRDSIREALSQYLWGSTRGTLAYK